MQTNPSSSPSHADRNTWRPPTSSHPLIRARSQLTGAVAALEDRASDYIVGAALHAALIELERYLDDMRDPDGILADVVTQAPRLRSEVKRLRAEAGRLIRRLRAMTRRTHTPLIGGGPAPAVELRRLHASLGRLHSRETSLILDAEYEPPALD